MTSGRNGSRWRDGVVEGDVVTETLGDSIRDCRLCASRFAMTDTAHSPRPVVWFHPSARILVAGQAPGLRVHQSGRPFTDRSGDRLRHWMGVDRATFYDQARIAIVPMAFCFPGYRRGADLPPPPVCASTWRTPVMAALPNIRLTILLGAAALRWHLGAGRLGDHIAAWRDHAPAVFPLPHPSWRNTAWLRKHPVVEDDIIPALRTRIKELL